MFAEISGKPARLQLQLGWDARCGKQSQLADARAVAQLCVAIREVPHARIMRRAWANVTPWVMHGCRVVHVSRVLCISGEHRLPACSCRQPCRQHLCTRTSEATPFPRSRQAAETCRLAACAPQSACATRSGSVIRRPFVRATLVRATAHGARGRSARLAPHPIARR